MLEKKTEFILKKASIMQSFYPQYYETYLNTDQKITADVALLLDREMLGSERPKAVRITVEVLDDPDTTEGT